MRNKFFGVVGFSLFSLWSNQNFALSNNMCVDLSHDNEDSLEALFDSDDLQSLLSSTIISTASKRNESQNCTPVTTVVVTAKQINERHYVNLVDLLEDVAGVSLQRRSRSSYYNNVNIHSHSNSSTFLILQDGVRIDAPMGGNVPLADNFPLYAAKQVEILMGPVAALYGADAFAGVINIITSGVKDKSDATISVSKGFDDYNYYQGLAFLKLGKHSGLHIGGHSHHSDNADLSALYPEQFAKQDATTFAGDVIIPANEREDYQAPVKSRSAFIKLNIGKHFTLGYQHSFFRSLTSTGDRPDTALYATDGQWNTQLDSVYAKYNFNVNHKLSGELLVNYSGYEVDPRSKYKNIFVNFSDDGYQYAKGHKHSIAQQLDYQLADSHVLLGGVEYNRYYALPSTPSLPQPFNRDLSPQEQGLTYSNTNDEIPIQIFDIKYQNIATYLQLQSSWNERLSSTVGLRYDKNSRYASSVNPRLGLVYQLNDKTTLRTLYGEAFRAPSPKESYDTFGTFSGKKNEQGEYLGSRFRSPNPNLEPEKSRSLSFGIDHLFTSHLHLSSNFYYTEVDNLIFSQKEAIASQYIPNARLSNSSIKQNSGEERHYGFDLMLNAKKNLSVNWQTDLWGSYSFADGSVKQINDNIALDLPYLSRHQFKLGATLRYKQKYFITPKLYFIGKTNSGLEDKDNQGKRLQSDAFFLAHLHLGAENITKGLSVYLNINNLLNRRYSVAGGSGSTTFTAMPQAGRHMILGLRYQFN